ncbi:MAG: OmpA/MotB family protein [Candidatus Marinamargulisbacteria bacterium]
MKKRPQRHPSRKNDDYWMVSYSDVVTSLLAFFVLIVAISTIDQQKVEYIQESIQTSVLKKPYTKPFVTLEEQLKKIIETKQLQKDVFVEADNTGINITFSSGMLYESGSANLQKNSLPFLSDMATLINDMNYTDILIEVNGHTDDVPIRTMIFPSNWELSAARATHVVRFLMKHGIKKNKLKASGYADSRPKVPNIIQGIPDSKNRATNRRVTVSVRRHNHRNMPKAPATY